MCIAQFNLVYFVVLVVAILPITRPAIASHNLARFNPGINPGIPGLSKLNPEIPGLAKRSGIAFPSWLVLVGQAVLYNASLADRVVSIIAATPSIERDQGLYEFSFFPFLCFFSEFFSVPMLCGKLCWLHDRTLNTFLLTLID